MRLRSFCHRPTDYESGVSFRFRLDFFPRRARLLYVAFFSAQIDVYGLRTFARQFPRAVASSLHVSDARVSARAVRADCSRTAKYGNFCAALYGDFCPSPRNCLIAASSRNGKNRTLTLYAQTREIERQRFGTKWATCLTRFSVHCAAEQQPEKPACPWFECHRVRSNSNQFQWWFRYEA